MRVGHKTATVVRDLKSGPGPAYRAAARISSSGPDVTVISVASGYRIHK